MVLCGGGDPRLMATVERDRIVGAGLAARLGLGRAITDRAERGSQASACTSSQECSSCGPHYNPPSRCLDD